MFKLVKLLTEQYNVEVDGLIFDKYLISSAPCSYNADYQVAQSELRLI